MKIIIVPTDFSESGANAVNYAAQFAKDLQARLIIFHSTEKGISSTENNDESASAPEGLLKLACETIFSQYGITAQCITTQGSFLEDLLRLIENFSADLIIMGSQGMGKTENELFGSNTLKVISHVFCPVLLVPREVSYKLPKHIAYASELTESEIPALKLLLLYAGSFNAQVDLVHINKLKELTEGAKQMLTKMNEYLDINKINIRYIEEDNVADGIESYISNNPVDLIALAKEKRSGLKKIFYNSLTKKLSRRLSLPLMVFQKITPPKSI